MSSRLRRLTVPDLAFAAAVFTMLFALVLFDGSRKLFRDSDSGWHIRNGEAILATGSLPRTDRFSWSAPGGSWYSWEWGADALMGWVHRSDGLSGVAALYLGLLGLVSWLWFRLHWLHQGDFLLACALASPMLSTSNLHWLARPHLFGWVLLLISLLWLGRLRAGAGWRAGLVAFCLAAVWANLHASFFLLPLLCLIYAAHHLARPLIWRDIEGPPEHAAAFVYLVAAGGAALGSFCNPYGWHLHLHVARYLTNAPLLERIGEFQSFNFHTEGSLQILVTVMVAMTGAVVALGQRNLVHSAILFGFSALALRSARGLPILALLLPLANGAITKALSGALSGSPGRWLKNALSYSANLRRLEAGFGGYLLAPLALAAVIAVLHSPAIASRTGFPPDEFPVEASDKAVARLPDSARILAPDKFGGYLIYRFVGKKKVFFDGRSDYYGLEFMRDYIELVQVRPGFERHLDRFRFSHALLPVNYTLAAVLPKMGWRETYRDRTAVLFEAPATTKASIGGTIRNDEGLN